MALGTMQPRKQWTEISSAFSRIWSSGAGETRNNQHSPPAPFTHTQAHAHTHTHTVLRVISTEAM